MTWERCRGKPDILHKIKNFGFTQVKYNEGIISKLDLLQKKEAMLVTQKMVISSKTECIVNQISLYKAVAANI